MNTLDVIIAGTGGQGILLLTKTLGTAAVKTGLRVRTGEIHGLSQRGGSVQSFVRIGNEVYSPTIPMGVGDVLIGLEPLETLRSLKYLSPRGVILLNARAIQPNAVRMGTADYPPLQCLLTVSRRTATKVIHLDARTLVTTVAPPEASNMLMLGLFSACVRSPITDAALRESIQELAYHGFLSECLAAFDLGITIARKQL